MNEQYRVLIVEDNEDMQTLLRQCLASIGYHPREIAVACSLGEITIPADPQPEIILLDLGLPDSPAVETFLKVQQRFPYSPVIVLTGHADTDMALRTVGQGAEDFLVKGDFDTKSLLKSIKYAIARKRIANDYKRLFEDSPGAMYIYDIESYRFLAVNEAAIRQYGYSRAEFLSITAKDIRPESDVSSFLAFNQNVPDSYYDYGRWLHCKKEGQVFHVHIYARNTVFDGRKARLVFAVDIDKKVKAELALQEKSEEINAILNSITDAFFTVNSDWVITFVNNAFDELFNKTNESLIGVNLWTLFPEGQEQKFYSEYCRALKEQVSVHFEAYEPSFDVWVSVNAYPSKDGLAVYSIDITERKRIQDRVMLNEQNLRAIINNTEDIIWSIDRENKIITANDAFWRRIETMTGRKPHEVARADFDEELFGHWNEYFQRAFAGESYKMVRQDVVDGKEIAAEISFNPIVDDTGSVVGISCFSRDITQQYRHTKMIERQNEQLQRIAWIQSHEVRAPVASILGLTSLFNNRDLNDPLNAEVIAKVTEVAKSLDEVIHRITDHTDTKGV